VKVPADKEATDMRTVYEATVKEAVVGATRGTVTGTAAPVTGTTAAEATVRATPGPATSSEPQTPEGTPEDVLGESKEEPEMASELMPEVVAGDVPVAGAMIVVHSAARSPSHGAPAPFSPAPRTATAAGAGLDVVLGHPTPYAPDDIPLGEVVSTTHRALS
jgi:hypothetical protein